ncbi:MAG TPA: glycoside hydrolase [Planctomycetota bacterium]|nr:glycoside hydrolase [Planctomycetota bacterium]
MRAMLVAFTVASLAWSIGCQIDPQSYGCLRWRCIGPHRGGRTVGAAGIAERPNTFFIGVNNGGVWKTTDAGRTWLPIFDDQPTGSIGAIAVAPSQPDVLYVGSGEGLQRPDLSTGDGMYRSDDGGRTWRHLGLDDAQQIAAILVDPHDADRVFVAVLGHPYGPNEQRGVFRSLDGGRTWQKVLYADEDTGATALAFDPSDPTIVYATLWQARQGPWENGRWQGPGTGLFCSQDGGTTWRRLQQGLPTFDQGLGRIGIAIAPTDRNRMYALVDSREHGGIYRSEDRGETWAQISDEQRLWGRGDDFAELRVDPRNADVLYIANTSTYRSTDGGRTYTCIKGAPGGDDYHTIWINPLHPEVMLLAADQGATITVNGGDSWSSWYNQPTAQFYHVITDDAFPYRVYGGQQESGSVGITSRGPDGQITFRDWHPVGADEYAYIAPDPLHEDLVYGGKMTRFHLDTGVVEDVGPDRRGLGLRFLRTSPLVFSTVDKTALYLGAQVLLRTRDGGDHWDVISPDLTREHPDVPPSIGVYRTDDLKTMPRRGVIYTVAPSHKDAQVIWCGTDDGLIHVTTDGGGNWRDVTPPQLVAWSKVSLIDAGHFDAKTAYAAINGIRLDDQHPHILRTHDGGASWTEIVAGLPAGPVNAVREDPQRRGLLYCGTEQAVYCSFDDGAHWQSLRLNMPASSMRDLVVHGCDLVVGTHGRSFWILDGMQLLRELPLAGAGPHLFAPAPAFEVEWNRNTDTPLPPEEPAGQNPPDGAPIDYWLPAAAKRVTLEVVDTNGNVVRRFASDEPARAVDAAALTVMAEWARPPQVLGTVRGAHRFVWDLRGAPPKGARPGRRGGGQSLPIAAIWHDTPVPPRGPWVPVGVYTVRLTVDDMVLEHGLEVRADPRGK